jgi:hypothetical protein
MIDTPETFARKLDALISSDPDRDWSLDDRAVAMIAARDADIRAEAVRWIPVGERLPELRAEVLVRADRHTVIAYRFETGGHSFWYSGDESVSMRDQEISHWQPLPAAPAAERSDADG